jgi:uncharacterized Zn-finger protein
VQHLHNEHIGSRQKRYSCEWIDCTRKGQTHASAYALRAHMRSHTREKPFYCTLPGMFLSDPSPPPRQQRQFTYHTKQNVTATSLDQMP